MKWTAEIVLGLIGGIFSIICSFFALRNCFWDGRCKYDYRIRGSAVGLSILGIVGSVMVKSKAKVGGLMVIFRKDTAIVSA